MKSALLLLAVAALCSFSPVHADEACCDQKTTIQARIREIDVNVLLRQYETVQTELGKMQMHLALLDLDEGKSVDERKKEAEMLLKRRQAMEDLSDRYLARLQRLAEVELANK